MIDKTAIIDPSAIIDESAIIGPNVVIGKNVKIGARTRVIANAYIEYANIGSKFCRMYQPRGGSDPPFRHASGRAPSPGRPGGHDR